MDSHHSSHFPADVLFRELQELKKQQCQMKQTVTRMEKGMYCNYIANYVYIIALDLRKEKIAQLERGIEN